MSDRSRSPIDEEALDRLTGGSESLKVERLSLFALEAPRLLGQAMDAGDPTTRRDRLMALVRVSENCAARDVAAAAAAAVGRTDAAVFSELQNVIAAAVNYGATAPGDRAGGQEPGA